MQKKDEMKSFHPLYNLWRSMKSRCDYNYYPRHGAIGITYCDRWKDFWLFVEDVGPRPTNKHSLDRIDNKGNYTPYNIRWATSKEQMHNITTNVNICFNNKTQCISAWADELGMKPNTLLYRLRRNWSVERALTLVVQK